MSSFFFQCVSILSNIIGENTKEHLTICSRQIQFAICRCAGSLKLSLDREDIASRHAASSCASTAPAYGRTSISDLLWPCGNRHKCYLCLPPLRAIIEEAGVEEARMNARIYVEGVQCASCMLYRGWILKEASLSAAQVLASTGILNIYDVRLGERKVPWANAGSRWVSGSPQRQSRREILREDLEFYGEPGTMIYHGARNLSRMIPWSLLIQGY